MDVELSYGETQLLVRIPPGAQVDMFASRSANGAKDAIVSGEIEVGADMGAFLSGEPPLVVINDAYRSTPTARILDWLDRIDGDLIDRASFLVATGAHDAPTPDQLSQVFGSHLARVRPRLSCHDARDYGAMTSIGVDSLGGEAFVSSRMLQARKVLAISSVEPHYFAGFTGGRKSFFPGLCDFATIERNHNLAGSLEAAPLELEGNPVAEHLAELMAMLGSDKIFAVQAVIDSDGRVADLLVGKLEDAFGSAKESARRLFARQIDGQYDVVISELLPPLDRNLYQVQKAVENTQGAASDGGAVIALSPCTEGVGSPYFFDLAAEWNREKNAPSDGQKVFGSHKLSRLNAITGRVDVRLYSELPSECVRRVFYEPVENVDEFLKTRSREKQRFRVAVVRDAGHTVLIH